MEQAKLYQRGFEKVLQYAIDKSFYKNIKHTDNDVKITAEVKSMQPIKVEYRVKFVGDKYYTKFDKTLQTVMKNKEIDFDLIIARERFDLSRIVKKLRKERVTNGKDIQ